MWYIVAMTENDTNDELVWASAEVRRGRKPLGQKAMTDAERKRRSRELGRSSGEREFLVKVKGLHLDYVEALAKMQQSSTANALKQIADAALDRYVGVMRRSEVMLENGVDESQVDQFIFKHLFPELPPIEERKSK